MSTAIAYHCVASAAQAATPEPDPTGPKLVAYYRVSTKKQGDSGLGLEGQDIAVERYREQVNGKIVKEFKEVETGTNKRTRPTLRAAMAECKRIGATLVIAKLDRLSRNVHFISGLMESRHEVPFTCCDNPHATPLNLHVLAAVAEHEAEAIAARVRDALHAYKANKRVSKATVAFYANQGRDVPADVVEARAGKLGALLPECRNLTAEGSRKGAATTGKKYREQAIRHHDAIAPRIILARVAGKSFAAIAAELNAAGLRTRGGHGKKPTAWTATPVRRIYERLTRTPA